MALALVVIEEHTRAAMHLRNDDPLGAVDDEGAVRGHERHVAHVHILLLDVLDRLGLGLGIDIEHNEAQRHLERRREGHAALAALVDIVFRRFILVLDEFEMSGVSEVLDREHRLEHRLQPLVWTSALRRVHQQELIIRGLLDFDQVRHLADFLDVPEHLANALAASECLRHVAPLKLALPAAVVPTRQGCASSLRPVFLGRVADAPSHSNFHRQSQKALLKVSWRPVDDAPPPQTSSKTPERPLANGRDRPVLISQAPRQRAVHYLSSTFAPAFSKAALIFSASSLLTPSLTGFGAASTRSFASFRPSAVMARTSLITSIFLSPIAARITLNSVCSSTGAAAAPGAGKAASATAAAAETPHLPSSSLASSAASRTVRLESSSTIFSRLAIDGPPICSAVRLIVKSLTQAASLAA